MLPAGAIQTPQFQIIGFSCMIITHTYTTTLVVVFMFFQTSHTYLHNPVFIVGSFFHAPQSCSTILR